MPKFTDTITIKIAAGNGGHGCVSFRREKYVEKGGPDGGDGGVGGNVNCVGDINYTNLSYLYKDRTYRAGNGRPGEGRNKHGADGEELTLKLPVGTEIIDEESGEVIADIITDEQPVLLATGGRGGKGNAFFKSATFQVPRFSQSGEEGESRTLRLNLKLIADVGLIGLPNAGKSTFLSVVTNAKPKIADYPFTTLIPNLGVVNEGEGEFTIADIPGIIEGAHEGHGLGLSFLQHIERVRVLLFFIDIQDSDPIYTLKLLQSELSSYNEKLLDRPFLIALTKTDLTGGDELEKELIDHFSEQLKDAGISAPVVAISSSTGKNTPLLLKEIEKLLR